LLAVVVPGQLRRHLTHEWVLRGVKLRPPCGDGREEGRSIRVPCEEAGARGVLSCEAEDVVHKRGRAVELRSFGDAERLELPADALEDLQHRGLPRLTGELGAHPGMCVDRVEHSKGNGTDRLPRLRTADHLGHDPGDDVVGGRRKQIALVGDVPVDRPAPCGQASRESAESQSALAVGVEDLHRGLDDSLLRERVRAPFGPLHLGRHEHHLDTAGTLFQDVFLEQCSSDVLKGTS
jgi:hypothetical protein